MQSFFSRSFYWRQTFRHNIVWISFLQLIKQIVKPNHWYIIVRLRSCETCLMWEPKFAMSILVIGGKQKRCLLSLRIRILYKSTTNYQTMNKTKNNNVKFKSKKRMILFRICVWALQQLKKPWPQELSACSLVLTT